MTKPPSKQLDQFVVRLPEGMRDRIKAAADANHRSMNAEIVAALDKAFPGNPFDLHALIGMLERYRQGEDIVVNGQKYFPRIDENGAIKLHLLEEVTLPEDFEYEEDEEEPR